MKEVYVVYGNTYFYGYGEYINLFGVFDTLEAAEEERDKTQRLYFEEELKDPHTTHENRNGVLTKQ